MDREQTIKTIEKEKLIVITRGITGDDLVRLAKALYAGGIRCFEITYDPSDPNTLAEVKKDLQRLDKELNGQLLLGIGTVLTKEQLHNAKDAGAKFIVSPNFNPEIVKETLKLGLVSVPGVMTPTEICAADEAGADFIKFFPAGTLGVKYCKDIYAPIHHVKYLATVGVSEETLREYLDLGFAGAGVSSQLIDKKLRDAGKFDELTKRAKRFVSIVNEYN